MQDCSDASVMVSNGCAEMAHETLALYAGLFNSAAFFGVPTSDALSALW